MRKLFKKKNSILVLEGRGDPQGKIENFFNHNHHRYFNGNSLELIMIKHGWIPFLTTQYQFMVQVDYQVSPAYGRFSSKKPSMKSFKKIISNGKKKPLRVSNIDLSILNI